MILGQNQIILTHRFLYLLAENWPSNTQNVFDKNQYAITHH